MGQTCLKFARATTASRYREIEFWRSGGSHGIVESVGKRKIEGREGILGGGQRRFIPLAAKPEEARPGCSVPLTTSLMQGL